MSSGNDFLVTHGVFVERHSSLYERMSDAWQDMRASTRRLILEKPSEARLLFYVMMSDMIFFLSWSIKALVSPTAGAAARMPLEVAFWLVVALFFRTSTLYLCAILLGSVARICGGTATWRETRTAIFWGALVAAPFGFACAMITVVLSVLEPRFPALGADWITLPPYWLSLIPFVYFISAGIAEAHQFRRTSTVFAMMSVAAVVAIFGFLVLRA